ncbi:MAG: hypothetical protein U0136_18540 [Bdellovibrionota bacterium]
MASPSVLSQNPAASPSPEPSVQDAAVGFHDIKPLAEFHPFPYAAVWSAIAAVAALLVGWFLWRRRRARAGHPLPAAPMLSPYESALQEIRRLELLRKDRRISLRDYGTGISLAMRLYLERVFAFPASDQTVSEVVTALPASFKRALPLVPRERAAELTAELRGRLKFFERLAFAADSSELFHWDSPELLDAIERSLSLLKDFDAMTRKEEERRRSVTDSGRAPSPDSREAL